MISDNFCRICCSKEPASVLLVMAQPANWQPEPIRPGMKSRELRCAVETLNGDCGALAQHLRRDEKYRRDHESYRHEQEGG